MIPTSVIASQQGWVSLVSRCRGHGTRVPSSCASLQSVGLRTQAGVYCR